MRRRTPDLSRRDFVRLGASAAALLPMAGAGAMAVAAPEGSRAPADDPWKGLKVGVASYSFKELSPEEAAKATARVGVGYASIKEFHLPLKSTAEERKGVARTFRDAGITLLSCGVVTMTDDPSEVRNAFEYARDAGIPTIVCKPTRASLPMLDALVKEFDIRLAIHNHGPEDKVWPSPLDVWEAIQPFDERIGVCVDVGHTARCGVDPAKAFRTCAARLYDVHIKDLASMTGKSQPVEVGRGVLDVTSMLRTLLALDYAHHVGLEYEKDLKDPIPGVAESLGYVKGVLSGMDAQSKT